MLRIALSCALALATGLPLYAQKKSVKPGINDSFKDPDVPQFVGRFEREGRDVFDRREEIVAALGLKAGMVVADVGAGTGLFTRLISPLVGAKGKVYAVDISDKFVAHIEHAAKQQKMDNIVGVVCTPDSVDLPAESVDLAFICDTYHHFEFPQRTMRSIHKALKPGGQVVLIDFRRIEGVSSEWVLGHVRAGQDVFTKEIIDAGFKQIDEKKGLLKESYFVRFEKVQTSGESAVRRDDQGFLVHEVRSPCQASTTQIRVLLPDELPDDARAPVVYVLPVEAGNEHRYGDGLLEVKQQNLHNRHGVIFVAPTFSHLPWYADHPTDPTIRQETYLLNVVLPLVERTYPVQTSAPGRLLLGFSKSGWGAWSLLLRHPDVFGRATAWAAPMMMEHLGKYGTEKIFSTQDNFEAYRVSDLLRKKANALGSQQRLILTGYGGFRQDHRQIHALLCELGIAHTYRDGPQRKHNWHSGWVEEAVQLLVASDKSQPGAGQNDATCSANQARRHRLRAMSSLPVSDNVRTLTGAKLFFHLIDPERFRQAFKTRLEENKLRG